MQAGINLVATELFIDSAQFDIEKRERKKAIEFVIDQYRFDVISFDDAVVDLNGLGLETIETELAQFDLLKVKQQKTKIPSKADLDKFLKGGIIEDEDYITMLEQHGYSNDWANKYLSLIKSTETT